MELLLIGFILGGIVGVFIGAFVGSDKITNHIGKIKKNDAPVDVLQDHENPKKKGLLKRIFTKKDKR